jgi:quercetin dioxygenase-like cupin family protein
MGETSTDFLATGSLTNGAFTLVEERALQGEQVPLHRHPDDNETFYVLEGEMSFFLDDQPGQVTTAGAFVHIPGGTIHGFRIESESARYLILTTARHGEFYRAITLPSVRGMVEDSVIARACGDYGIEFVGPLPD